MSFVILALIIFLIYACLTKYGNMGKVALISAVICGMTAGFIYYGLKSLASSDVFTVVGTEINSVFFIHVCAVWIAADLICIYKIIKNYRYYLEINSVPVKSAEQGQE